MSELSPYCDGVTNGSWEGGWYHSATSTANDDVWEDGVEIPSVMPEPSHNQERMGTDASIRYNGRPRMALNNYDAAFTNTEPYATSTSSYAITTNSRNLTDIWVVGFDGTFSELHLVRLDP